MLAIGLSLVFMVFEIVGGLWANSLAILSDAAHLLTDIAGFVIALIATMMAAAPASKHYSFGLARAEVMGALASILSLWVLTLWLIVEAYGRTVIWYNGGQLDIDGKLMFVIACIGVLINICLSFVFMEDHGGAFHAHDHSHGHSHSHESSHPHHDVELAHKESHDHDHDHDTHDHAHDHDDHDHDHDHKHETHSESSNLLRSPAGYGSTCDDHSKFNHHDHHASNAEPSDVNIQAAYLHVITDLIQSIGVALAGLLIWIYPEYQILDPICTFIFSGLVIWSTFSLLGRVITILFEGVPAHVDYTAVREALESIPGVIDVHDLHIWSISSQATSLTCHIMARDPQKVLVQAHAVCSKFGIHHTTIQVQDANDQSICCQNPQSQCM